MADVVEIHPTIDVKICIQMHLFTTFSAPSSHICHTTLAHGESTLLVWLKFVHWGMRRLCAGQTDKHTDRQMEEDNYILIFFLGKECGKGCEYL